MLIPFRLNHCDLESSAWPNHEKCETLVHLLSFVTKNILSFQWLNSTNCKLLFRVWQCFVIVTELVCCKLLFWISVLQLWYNKCSAYYTEVSLKTRTDAPFWRTWMYFVDSTWVILIWRFGGGMAASALSPFLGTEK